MYVLVWLTKYSSPGQKILPLPLSRILSTQLDQHQLALKSMQTEFGQDVQNCKLGRFFGFHINPGLKMRPVGHEHLIRITRGLFHCLDV